MEADEQKEFISWFGHKWPEHKQSIRISLRGLNFGGGKRAAIMINHIKSQGSVDGESDIAILLPRGKFGSLLIEHKGEGQAHRLSGAQISYLDYHNTNGNCAVSTRGLKALKAAVAGYMELR